MKLVLFVFSVKLFTALPALAQTLASQTPYTHVPNTYCGYYASGGDGPCSSGRPFDDVWQQCEDDGSECMGVMWNSCTGPTSDTSVNGAWKLMTKGQDVGDANNPTSTCGGKDQALGHWDVFVRNNMPIVVEPSLNECEILRLELIVGCTGLLAGSFWGLFAYAGCMTAAATAWHICFENMDRRLLTGDETTGGSSFDNVCGDECLKMLREDVDVPELNLHEFHGLTDEETRVAYDEGVIYCYHLVAKIDAR